MEFNSISGIATKVQSVVGNTALKFQEFTTSGTFTPTAAAISAGGIHEVFLVGGGERGSGNNGGAGGQVVEKYITLANTNAVTVTIGAGGGTDGADGGNSVFTGTDAGGVDLTASGGSGLHQPTMMSSGAGGTYTTSTPGATISPATVSITINPARVVTTPNCRTHGYQSAYAYGYRYSYQSAYANSTSAGTGYKGFGAGGKAGSYGAGIDIPKENSGQGSRAGTNAANGYCLVVWYE